MPDHALNVEARIPNGYINMNDHLGKDSVIDLKEVETNEN